MGPAVAEERGDGREEKFKKTQTKMAEGTCYSSGENRRKDAASCAGIRKEMPWPGAGSWVRPAGGGCQRLQPRWMRGEEGAGGQQTAAATEGGRASSQHEETAEGQLDRESEKA